MKRRKRALIFDHYLFFFRTDHAVSFVIKTFLLGGDQNDFVFTTAAPIEIDDYDAKSNNFYANISAFDFADYDTTTTSFVDDETVLPSEAVEAATTEYIEDDYNDNLDDFDDKIGGCPTDLETCVNACVAIDNVFVYSLCVNECGKRCT